mmetsp:Transcript_70714/g.133512  ORF Transcript_70714/g.133512 Transcript_70714/m.133512 type:complete len:664 (+) Transcript_70714:137-2128(+)
MGETGAVAAAAPVAAAARTPSAVVTHTNSPMGSNTGAPGSLLAPRAGEKGGLATPETGTPPPRSVSPSSDGGTSLPPPEQASSSESRCCRSVGTEGSDERDTTATTDGTTDAEAAAETSSVAVGGSEAAACSDDGACSVEPDAKPSAEDVSADTEAQTTLALLDEALAKAEVADAVEELQMEVVQQVVEHYHEYDGQVIDPESADPPPASAAKPTAKGKKASATADTAASASGAASASDAVSVSSQPSRETRKKGGHGKNKELARAKQANQLALQQHGVALSAAVFAGMPLPSPADAAALGFATGPNSAFSDRRIIEVLAAPESAHKRLLKTAKRVPEIIQSKEEVEGEVLAENVELYGSLSLDMSEPEGASGRPWQQDWATYYINGRSDVDFVVEMRKGISPTAIANRLLGKGPWRLVGQTQVHKFASTQYTLLGSFGDDEEGDSTEVYLDVTCIESPLHFTRFKSRQEAFRKVFTDVRFRMEAQFGGHGAVAFDGYIHLLKAFAAKVPGNALTGFQATCIGLFTLQIGHFRLKPMQSIALSLFEGFLRFCFVFYSDTARPTKMYWKPHYHYRTCGIDLSEGGRWLPRMSLCWRSELYFMAAEVKMMTRPDERVNVVHSLDPVRVSGEAHALLSRAFLNCDYPRIPFPTRDFLLGAPTATSN